MQRKPRDPKKDRLVSPTLLLYSYVVAGFILSAACMAAMTMVYNQNGIKLSDFYQPDLNSDKGAFFTLLSTKSVTIERTGRTYTPEEQHRIFSKGITTFYIALTVGQFGHVWSCKTRFNSLFVHGFENKSMFYGIGLGFFLVIFFCYIPGVHKFVGSYYANWTGWVWAIIAGFVLLIYNEGIKYHFRTGDPKKSCLIQFLSW
jgi:sodium/potassium-transporting ATPase subunit alpha